MTGQVFGRLTALSISGSDKQKRRKWLCACACGKTVECISTSLTSGRARSCGCFNREIASKNVTKYAMPRTVKHGLSGKHPLYWAWTGMIGRCENPNGDRWQNYGGKGVTVCQEWRVDFMVFYTWAMSSGWKPGLQLDRKKSELNYCPDNCQWLGHSEHSTKTATERWALQSIAEDKL